MVCVWEALPVSLLLLSSCGLQVNFSHHGAP